MSQYSETKVFGTTMTLWATYVSLKERKTPETYDSIKISMFKRKDQFPLLKGKARELRHLAHSLLDVCTRFLDGRVKVHAQIKLALTKLAELDDIMDAHRDVYRFPGDVGKRFQACAQAFVGLNAALRRHFEGVVIGVKPVLLFHLTIKYHYLLHIADIGLYLNPRMGWCYAGESLMHRVRILIQASCRGIPAHMLGDKVLKKYTQALAMELAREKSENCW